MLQMNQPQKTETEQLLDFNRNLDVTSTSFQVTKKIKRRRAYESTELPDYLVILITKREINFCKTIFVTCNVEQHIKSPPDGLLDNFFYSRKIYRRFFTN